MNEMKNKEALEAVAMAVADEREFEVWWTDSPEMNEFLSQNEIDDSGNVQSLFFAAAYIVWKASRAGLPAQAVKLLAADHSGMKVDYRGLFSQVQRAIKRTDPGYAEMIRQLEGHLQELGQRWYAGDTNVVDEILQLYCIERDARKTVLQDAAAAPKAQAEARDVVIFEQRMSDWQHGDALDAERYRWLRSRDLETISQGGVFAGMTPENIILNEEDLDQAVDAAIAAAKGAI